MVLVAHHKQVAVSKTEDSRNLNHKPEVESLVYDSRDLETVLKLSRNAVNLLLNSGKLTGLRYGRKWLVPKTEVSRFLMGGIK